MRKLKVTPIRNGTVIDHIEEGMALKVLRILGITGEYESVVSVAMHVPSGKMGRKDIVKIEDRELDAQELNKIALIAPNATYNIIRDYRVKKKHRVQVPPMVEGILRCGNPNCISNKREPVQSKSVVISKRPLRLKCYYCEREQIEIEKNII
jgi:aspartate carbamoyltransferase regulatory subunit